MESDQKEDDIAPLVEALHQGSKRSRRAAVHALAAKGSQAESAVPALLKLLNDGDLSLRGAAADALTRIGQPSVSVLIDALNTEDPDFRKAVVVTLAKLGPRAVAAVPALSRLTEDEWLGPWAIKALQCIREEQSSQTLRGLRLVPGWALCCTALGGILLVGIAIWFGIRGFSLQGPPQAAVTAGLGLAVLGASMGFMLGFRVGEGRKAVLLIALLGIGGGMAGVLLGGLFAALVEPLVEVLGR